MWRCFFLLGLFAVGCGGGAQPLDMGGADGKLVAEVVENFNDATSSSGKMAKSFANGSGPVAGKKYASYSFFVVGKPSVKGDQATCKIRIDKLNDGTSLGEQEWSFVKEGSDWKIKSAPIP